jgi:hypothetical protein
MPLLFKEGGGMDAKTYLKVSVVNLTFLLAGMGIRAAMETHVVHAQAKQDVEESGKSAAFETLLAGRIAADQIMIKGIDIGKLQENVINVLATKSLVVSQSELQNAVNNARVTPLRMKIPEVLKPAPTPQGAKP